MVSAIDRSRAARKLFGDLGYRQPEDVAHQDHRPLAGGQMLYGCDERELSCLALVEASLRPRRIVGDAIYSDGKRIELPVTPLHTDNSDGSDPHMSSSDRLTFWILCAWSAVSVVAFVWALINYLAHR